MAMTVSVNLFTEKDFVAAFNEWARRTEESPAAMDRWMVQHLEYQQGDKGAACTNLLFSILHDNKKKEGTHE